MMIRTLLVSEPVSLSQRATNYLIAAGLTLAVGAWLLLGMLLDEPPKAAPSAQEKARAAAEPFEVAVSTRKAQSIERTLEVQGEAEPDRSATLRAQTAGQLTKMAVAMGERVEAGDLVARIEVGDREAQLSDARALRAQRRQELEAAKRLGSQGFQSKLQLQQARAALAAAEAQVKRLELDLERTAIRAPFAGTVAARHAEQGDYAGVGGEIVTLVDNQPLKIVIHVAEQDIRRLSTGVQARVTLQASGEQRTGTITAIAPRADEQTRTYRVEVQVPNPSGVPAGGTVTVTAPVGKVAAHALSPAILTLDSAGRLGVKTVDAADKVAFHPVEVVRSGTDGIWVTGLPREAAVITRGAGFVTEGERVRRVPEKAVEAAEAPPGPASLDPVPEDAS